MKQSTLCILSLLGGAVIGSVVALAFAPKSGKEMRGMVRDFVNDNISKWGSCSCNTEDASCSCEEK